MTEYLGPKAAPDQVATQGDIDAASLATADQTLAGFRVVDDGDAGLGVLFDFKSGSHVAQFLVACTAGLAKLSSTVNDGTNGVTLFATPSSYNMVFSAACDLQLNSSAGTAGQRLVSNGAGAGPSWANPSILIQDTAPGSPVDGQIWSRPADDDLYRYDSGRSKWLSVMSVINHDIGLNQSIGAGVGHYLSLGGNNRTMVATVGTERGLVVPWDATFVGWIYHSGGTVTSWNHNLVKFDVSANTSTNVHTYKPSLDSWDQMSLNIDFDKGDVIGVSQTGGASTIPNSNMTILLQRRAV